MDNISKIVNEFKTIGAALITTIGPMVCIVAGALANISGFKYLKDLEIGSKFKTASGLTGILLDISTNVKVKITDAQSIEEEDIKYYLGKKTIAAKTEVKEVK